METDEWSWPARESGIVAEGQFLAFARSEGYKPEYEGGNKKSFDLTITKDGTTSTVDVKGGFPWRDGRLGFMGRDPKSVSPQIRADYLGLVIHDNGKNARLYGDRLEFPEHRGIYLVPSQAVEELFVRGVLKADGVTPTGKNVYATPESLERYKVPTGTGPTDQEEAS